MQPTEQTEEKPAKRQLPDAMKVQVIADHFKTIVLALGVENHGQSLAQLSHEAKVRAEAAKNVLNQAGTALAYLDGVIDSLGYSKPDDIKRAKRQAESAHRALQIAIKTAMQTG